MKGTEIYIKRKFQMVAAGGIILKSFGKLWFHIRDMYILYIILCMCIYFDADEGGGGYRRLFLIKNKIRK